MEGGVWMKDFLIILPWYGVGILLEHSAKNLKTFLSLIM